MMTEACGATNCTMMEVGEAISSMMKVCGATKSLTGWLYLCRLLLNQLLCIDALLR